MVESEIFLLRCATFELPLLLGSTPFVEVLLYPMGLLLFSKTKILEGEK